MRGDEMNKPSSVDTHMTKNRPSGLFSIGERIVRVR